LNYKCVPTSSLAHLTLLFELLAAAAAAAAAPFPISFFFSFFVLGKFSLRGESVGKLKYKDEVIMSHTRENENQNV
jgi:hypothetical protein